MEEIWKDIKDYEGLYQVSNFGNVRSLDRIVKDTNKERYQRFKGCVLKSTDNGHGYQLVFLTKNCKRKNFYVHRLVAETFIPNINNLPEVNHKNLNKKDNNANNLEWVTQKQNKTHFHNTDLAKIIHKNIGEKNHQKLLQRLQKYKNILIDGYVIQNKTIGELNKETGIGEAGISSFLKQNGIIIDNVQKKRKRNTMYIPDNREQWKKLKRDKLGRFLKKEEI